jgi:hypothetical protein
MDISGPETEPPLTFNGRIARRGGEEHPGIGHEAGDCGKRL